MFKFTEEWRKKLGLENPYLTTLLNRNIFLFLLHLSQKKYEMWVHRTHSIQEIQELLLIFFVILLCFFLFFFLPPSLVSFLSPSVLQFCFCFKSQNSEIRGKKFTGGTIASVSQSKTLIHFELGLWQISIIHISKSTLISHSRPDLGGPEHN